MKNLKQIDSTSPDWDSWFLETHGGTGKADWEDEDVDEVDFEQMDDKDEI